MAGVAQLADRRVGLELALHAAQLVEREDAQAELVDAGRRVEIAARHQDHLVVFAGIAAEIGVFARRLVANRRHGAAAGDRVAEDRSVEIDHHIHVGHLEAAMGLGDLRRRRAVFLGMQENAVGIVGPLELGIGAAGLRAFLGQSVFGAELGFLFRPPLAARHIAGSRLAAFLRGTANIVVAGGQVERPGRRLRHVVAGLDRDRIADALGVAEIEGPGNTVIDGDHVAHLGLGFDRGLGLA